MFVIGLIATISGVIAVIVAIAIYRRQVRDQNQLATRQQGFETELSTQQQEWQKELAEREAERDRELARQQQEWEEKLARRQEILNAGQQLSSHFTKWHDALRSIVNNGIRADFTHNKTRLEEYRDEVEIFKKNEAYEGPLEHLLVPFRRSSSDNKMTRQSAELVAAVEDFQFVATDFKDGTIGTINDMLIGKEHRKMKKTKSAEYKRRIEADFAVVHDSYRKAMGIIADVMAASDLG